MLAPSRPLTLPAKVKISRVHGSLLAPLFSLFASRSPQVERIRSTLGLPTGNLSQVLRSAHAVLLSSSAPLEGGLIQQADRQLALLGLTAS